MSGAHLLAAQAVFGFLLLGGLGPVGTSSAHAAMERSALNPQPLPPRYRQSYRGRGARSIIIGGRRRYIGATPGGDRMLNPQPLPPRVQIPR